jgi:hypothetical protein
MRNPGVSVVPDAIRIEDEVWQDAFARRERATRRRSEPTPVAVRPAAQTQDASGVARASGPSGVARATQASGVARASGPSGVARATRPPAPPGGPAVPAYRAGGGEPLAGRRTVTIRGRGAEGHLPWPGEGRTQRTRRAHERHGFRPDRFAMWAVFLGLLLIAVAVASPHS